MLTADLVRPRLRRRNGMLHIQMLDAADESWRRTAQELIVLFRGQIGQTQAAWETALDAYEGERTDYVVLRGLAKVLTDHATFAAVETACAPVDLRERLFARGPVFATPDLFNPKPRHEVLAEVCSALGITPEQGESALFADRPAEYVLADAGPEWTASDLIARYNVELARGVLYWAAQVQVEIYDGYKDFWRYLKLFKLMFEAQPHEGGYRVLLDGPISPFVAATTRYGRQFAAFLPALFLSERWQMAAQVRAPGSNDEVIYRLDHASPLLSHFRRSAAFDSRLEADFAAEFAAKFGSKRGAWELSREDEVIVLGDTVMIPDFAVTHRRGGQRALIEIVGYWHPDYLRRKVEKVRAANRSDLILLVYEGVNLSAERLRDVPGDVLYFTNKPVLKDVMAAVKRCAR